MARLTNGEALTDVGAGDETQAADESSSAVGENVTVQVGGDDDVVVLGLAEELVDHGVDNLLLNGDGGVLGIREGPLGGGAEETIGLGQNVGLVGDGDKRRLVDAGSTGITDLLTTESNVTSHGSDAERSLLRDALNGLGDLALGGLVGGLLLDVQILSVLADNDHIDGLGGCQDGLDGSDVGVEVELLAQGDDGARVALDGLSRRAHGSEQGAIALILEDLDGLVGEGGTGLLKSLEAGLEVDKVKLEAERGGEGLKDAAAGGDDFLADAVTGDEA